ncbi:ERCC4-type nuclease [Sinorhizobium fredii]
MEQAGIIRGYTALVDTSDIETTSAVIINITLERQTEDHLDRFEAAVRKHPEIRECFLMTGGSDYLLRVEVANAGEFERIHKEILSTLPGVSRIHSSHLELKFVTLYAWPLHGRLSNGKCDWPADGTIGFERGGAGISRATGA